MGAVDEVLKYIATNEIRWIDLQFFDIRGALHRTTVSNKDIEEAIFSKGISAVDLLEVFPGGEQGELVLLPDPDTVARLPWEVSTIRLICDVITAITAERYVKDTRYVAERIEKNLEAMGIKTARIGTETEFYIFDTATVDRTSTGRGAGTLIDSREAYWSPSALSTRGKGSYVAQPYDSMYPARIQIAETMEDAFGYSVESHRHGRSQTSQQSVTISDLSLKTACDALATLKFVVRNLTNATNSIATFMPYPVEGERGSSLAVHQSLWKAADNNIFYDGNEEYAQLSQTARYYIGGLLEHAAALSLFTMPTTNSYKKLAQDQKIVGWSKLNRKAVVQIPYTKKNIKEKRRIVYTAADPSAHPYLAIPAIVAAGIDGIKNKIEPGDPSDTDEETKKRKVQTLPNSLYGAIEAFESDPKFIKGIMSSELVGDYFELKLTEYKESLKAVSGWELDRYWNV
jgi:glutamine synthetase